LKKVGIALFLLLVISSSAAARAEGYEQLPFSVGERLRFFIYASKLYVGYQTVDFVGVEEFEGSEVYKICGISRSSFLLSIIYRLDDKWTVFIDKDTLLPVRVEKDMTEGRDTGFFVYDINQEESTVKIHDRTNNKTEVVSSENLIFDLFSLIYYYRGNPAPFESKFTFDFLEPHALHPVEFVDRGVEQIIIPRISKKRTVSARKLQQIGGIGIEIFVSDDDLRVPLKMIVPSILPGNRKLLIEFYIDRFAPGKGHKGTPDQYRSLAY
jgi:hypothetical protein